MQITTPLQKEAPKAVVATDGKATNNPLQLKVNDSEDDSLQINPLQSKQPVNNPLQLQGRVQPIGQMKGKIAINDGKEMVVQRQQATELKAGLNMIGEFHDKYANENDRKTEQSKINEKLQKDIPYYIENNLLNADKSNYADPIDLRLEHLAALIKTDLDPIQSELQVLSTKTFEKIAEQEAIPTEDEVEEKRAQEINLLKSVILNNDQEKINSYINKQNYASWLLGELLIDLPNAFDTDAASGDEGETKLSEDVKKKLDNTFAYLQSLALVDFQKQSEGSSAQANKPWEELKSTFGKLGVRIRKYDNRLIPDLEKYQSIKSLDNFISKSSVNFSEDQIEKIKGYWKQTKEVEDIYATCQIETKGDNYVKTIISAAIDAIGKFIASLCNNEALRNGNHEELSKKRSRAMHDSAQSLKDNDIIWKVGEKHVEDIAALENQDEIKTEYTYIKAADFENIFK